MSGWTCPNEIDGMCQKVKGFVCTPGMKGCVLYGKVNRKSEDSVSDPDSLDETIHRKANEGPAGKWDAGTIRDLYSTRRHP